MAMQYLHEAHAKEVATQRALQQGVAVSAIAFAFHETADRSLNWSLVVIAAAVALWGISFAAGIFHSHTMQRGLLANLIERDAAQAGNGQRYRQAKGIFAKAQRRSARQYKVQLWTLLAGAMIYAVGHGMHLIEIGQRLPAVEVGRSETQLMPTFNGDATRVTTHTR